MLNFFSAYRLFIHGWFAIIIFFCFPQSARSQLPEITVSIDLKNTTVARILDEISNQTGYYFTYDSELFPGSKMITLQVQNIALETALDTILGEPSLQYQLIDKNIVIFEENSLSDESTKEEEKDIAEFHRLRGRIIDSQNGDELPFATILLHGTNKGTISNLQGKFSLVIPGSKQNPVIVTSMIGYKNSYVHLDPGNVDEIVISMEKDVISLQEIIFRYQNPVEIVHNMIDKIPGNYLDEPSGMNAYFREYVKKNKEFVTFSEAVLDISKTPYAPSIKNDNVKVIRGRKVQNLSDEDSIILKIQSGVNSSLQLDIVKNQPTFLLSDFEERYRMEYRNIVSYRNQQVYIVGFTPVGDTRYSFYKGKLYINARDYALVAADFYIDPEELRRNPQRFLVRTSPFIKLRPQEAVYHVEYRKKDDRYHVSLVTASVTFRLRKKKQWFSTSFNVGIEMAITEVQPGLKMRIPRSERLKPGAILSDQEFLYDPAFWGDYNIIEPEASLYEALNRMGFDWKTFGE